MESGDPTQPSASPSSASADRLDSWKEIAAYLKRDVRTVQRWEKKEGLPVHRHWHEKLGAVYAFRSEIDTWWKDRSPKLQAESELDDREPSPVMQAAPDEAGRTTPEHPAISADFLVGQVLGHYRVLEQVHSGAMGVVYRARDEQLDRTVILKVLPAGSVSDEDARKRFRNEALSLSRLNHPNIATIFELGSQGGLDFVVLEHIPGVSLDHKLAQGGMPEAVVVHLGVQMADGLRAAHAAGVIHCDLKPANLCLTPGGRLKILDFGLAKLVQPIGEAVEPETVAEVHLVSGTLPYMAPEQLLGKPPDPRSDIWAAGAVLYELITGLRPFREASAPRLFDAILHEPPQAPRLANPKVSVELERIILKCLEKEPERRYPSAEELAIELRRLKASHREVSLRTTRSRPLSLALATVLLLALAAAVISQPWPRQHWRELKLKFEGQTPIHSVAVLPLANLSGSSQEAPFVDGMHEALITDLAKIRTARVISRTTMETYKDTHKTLPEIARELNVEAVVEGSVLHAGNKVRITAKLIRAGDEQSLWAEDYERETLDSLSLIGTMAQGIADGIQANLPQEERARLAGRGPASAGALDDYLQGRYHLNKRTLQEVRLGADYFERAIRVDPTYAPAHAGLADAYILLGAISYDWMEPTKVIPKAEYEARKALELDPSSGEAHVSLANIQLMYYWDFAAAEQGFRKAEELDPNNATAHHWYARLLTQSGRWHEAFTELQHALQHDPKSLSINLGLAWYFYMAQRFDESIAQCNHVLALGPNFLQARLVMAMAYEEKGMYAQAIEAVQSDPRLRQNPAAFDGIPAVHMVLGRIYARGGKTTEARRELVRLTSLSREHYVPAIYFAILAAALGDKNGAFRYLEQSYAERSEGLLYVAVEPGFRDLRSDPRFADLLRRMGLPPSLAR